MGRSGDAEDAWRALLLAYNAALPAIEHDVRRTGTIPLSWYDVLLELKAAGADGLRMRELGERVVLSRTRVSRLVDEMARDGLVRKGADGDDRRVVWATITDAGRRALRGTAPAYRRGIQRHFGDHLTEEEAAVITRALLRVAGAGSTTVRLG